MLGEPQEAMRCIRVDVIAEKLVSGAVAPGEDADGPESDAAVAAGG